ncbi:MAG: hypothetical protein L0Z62_46965 [Gemmataceae bacterium]|nr:hypothetical protein [Gemmataceae bacterium]
MTVSAEVATLFLDELARRNIPVKVNEDGSYVIEITDQGIRAFAEFQKAPKAPAEDEEEETTEDGMKTIRYRGGTVVFCIPEHWEEEYSDEGGGTFYDEDSSGTLRLSTLLFESKGPVTTHQARDILEGSEEAERSEVIDLGGGNCMITYTKQAEEDGEPVTIYCWQLANPVPPQHLRMAIFRFWVPTADIDDEEIVEQRALIDREVRRCEFASEVGE